MIASLSFNAIASVLSTAMSSYEYAVSPTIKTPSSHIAAVSQLRQLLHAIYILIDTLALLPSVRLAANAGASSAPPARLRVSLCARAVEINTEAADAPARIRNNAVTAMRSKNRS